MLFPRSESEASSPVMPGAFQVPAPGRAEAGPPGAGLTSPGGGGRGPVVAVALVSACRRQRKDAGRSGERSGAVIETADGHRRLRGRE